MSFEKGIEFLGGAKILFPSKTLDKKEEHKDVFGYIQNWADYVVVRYGDYDKVRKISEFSNIPIINAMTAYNHPCEVLGDLYSIRERRVNYKDLTYTFVGERGNISTSYANLAKVLGLKMNHVFFEGNRIYPDDENYRFYTELDNVLADTDVILTDQYPDKLKNSEYYEKYQITLEKLKLAKSEVIINPCPPFKRGEEITAEVIDSEYFVGYDFKKNLQFVQQAIIIKALNLDK